MSLHFQHLRRASLYVSSPQRWPSPHRIAVTSQNQRAVEFYEKIVLNPPENARTVRIWIPVPQNDSYQQTEIVRVVSPRRYGLSRKDRFGNRTIYFEQKWSGQKNPLELSVQYRITRREQRGLSQSVTEKADKISYYLEQRGLETGNGKIKQIALDLTAGIKIPVEKARAIYRYVLKNMKYDKSGDGWGRGDAVYACDIGRGNCTDFHSLFIALCRAAEIPARFQMGIPLPETESGEPSGSYHCWAEFHADGVGWVPVDISEAWKNPGKEEYFFGNLDINRIGLTTGREILLSPLQQGPPLNYFSKPYVEIDGQPDRAFQLERRFKNFAGK